MDDCDSYNNGLVESSSYIIPNKKIENQRNDTVQLGSHPLGSATSTKKNSRATATNVLKKVGDAQKYPDLQTHNIISTEPYCHVKVDSIIKLKDSTKKLLLLLEDIQSKSQNNQFCPVSHGPNSLTITKPIPALDKVESVADVCESAIKRLEIQTKILETLPIPDEDDDCSIFKRLTRKCNCLNQQEYNDFVIHFNEETKYFTSTAGEVIKNLRIIKKFLYMGGAYTKHALMFLNQGLEDSSFTEKVAIVQGCAHADMCNVFEDVSIVATCIAWPYKYETYGDSVTQELAAAFIHKLSQLEEGRRYLKYTSKLNNDIRKVLKNKRRPLNINTIEALQATLDAIQEHKTEYNNLYSMPGDEGFGSQTMKALTYYRHYMTLSEIFTHLDLLNKLSSDDSGKTELATCLRSLVTLFQEMLREYDDSEMNIIITNIINNVVSKSLLKQKQEPDESQLPKVMKVADTATESIIMKNECNQVPAPKKRLNRSKKYLNMNNYKKEKPRQNEAILKLFKTTETFRENTLKSNIIIVPIEK